MLIVMGRATAAPGACAIRLTNRYDDELSLSEEDAFLRDL